MPNAYWMPWRPWYEGYAALAWTVGVGISLGLAAITELPVGPFRVMAIISACLALARAIPAYRLWRWKRNLGPRSLDFITLDQLQRRQRKYPGAGWLGTGFEWTAHHAQRVHEIMALSSAQLAPSGAATRGTIGVPWLHGVGARAEPILLPIEQQAGHLLLVGTTRSFKTKLLILIIVQAVLRGEPVIVIDPKGDREVRRAMQAACRLAGRPQAFVYFHPAFPDRSTRIDPLKNFSNATEIASRVAALIPSESEGSDPFKAFAWNALNTIVNGLLEVGERPNLLKLRHYVESGVQELLIRALRSYSERHLPDGATRLAPYLQKARGHNPDATLTAWLRGYEEVIARSRPSPTLEGLITMVQHDRVHFSKMVASLLPILGMLTSPPLDALLSPDPTDADDPRPLTDTAHLIENDQVAYIGLDSLTNATVGSAIGSLLTADLTAAFGTRYNFASQFRPVTIVIDEAAEALNEPLIAMLNKAGGGGARLVLATQTLGDLEARLGSEAKARQVLGNVNTLIAGRVRDAKTQQYIADGLPKTRVRRVQPSQGATSDASHPVLFSGGYQEAVQEEEAALFAPEWLGLMPNLEYIGTLGGGRLIKARLPILNLPDPPPDPAPPPALAKL
ncbi:MAG: conjugative transfer system coupling protein TraD [Candidatus Competibacteraceae bacterium]